jgi:hypothetical protein
MSFRIFHVRHYNLGIPPMPFDLKLVMIYKIYLLLYHIINYFNIIKLLILLKLEYLDLAL